MRRGNKVIFGIYEPDSIEDAVAEFKLQGFRNSDISVLMPRKGDDKAFQHEKNSKAPEGFTYGGSTGALLGGALGWLVGIGAITSTGLGPLIAAGPLMTALAGLGAGGAIGSITGALIGLGFPEYEAKRFESFVKEGGVLLSVHVDDKVWREKARRVMEKTNARDIAASIEEEIKIHDTRETDFSSPFNII